MRFLIEKPHRENLRIGGMGTNVHCAQQHLKASEAAIGSAHTAENLAQILR